MLTCVTVLWVVAIVCGWVVQSVHITAVQVRVVAVLSAGIHATAPRCGGVSDPIRAAATISCIAQQRKHPKHNSRCSTRVCLCALYNVLVHTHPCVHCTTFWCTAMRVYTVQRSGAQPCVCALHNVLVHTHA